MGLMMIEKLMMKLGYVPVAKMTGAVNRVAADAAVDRLAEVARRKEAEDALEATTCGIAIRLDSIHDRIPEMVS